MGGYHDHLLLNAAILLYTGDNTLFVQQYVNESNQCMHFLVYKNVDMLSYDLLNRVSVSGRCSFIIVNYARFTLFKYRKNKETYSRRYSKTLVLKILIT